jgi:hypothetical protein
VTRGRRPHRLPPSTITKTIAKITMKMTTRKALEDTMTMMTTMIPLEGLGDLQALYLAHLER